MDYAVAIAKRFVSFPFSFQRKRKMSKLTTPSELTQLGLDSMLSVLSYVDGESMYELGCANKSYGLTTSVTDRFERSVAHPHNWKNCTLDFGSMRTEHVFATLRRYGHLIQCVHICGSLTVCLRERLYQVMRQYCTNLEYVDSFGIPSFFPLSGKTTAFSITFPSCSSDYMTGRRDIDRYLMYSKNDCVVQCMDTHGQDLSAYQQSIWQFEISNHLCDGFSASFECVINSVVVGTFTINDASSGSVYAINLLYSIPKSSICLNHGYISLCVRCATQLPFGAGYARISSVGRVSFLQTPSDLKRINSTVPPFVLLF